jgi:hypothetical protein
MKTLNEFSKELDAIPEPIVSPTSFEWSRVSASPIGFCDYGVGLCEVTISYHQAEESNQIQWHTGCVRFMINSIDDESWPVFFTKRSHEKSIKLCNELFDLFKSCRDLKNVKFKDIQELVQEKGGYINI